MVAQSSNLQVVIIEFRPIMADLAVKPAIDIKRKQMVRQSSGSMSMLVANIRKN